MKTLYSGLALACVICWASSQAQADIFVDNFDSGASGLWNNDSGGWSDAGGVYQATAPDNSPNAHSSLSFQLTDFSMELDINNITDGGVWLRSAAAPGTGIGRTGVLLVTGINGGLYWHNVTNGNSYGSAFNAVTGIFTSGVSDPSLRIEVTGDDYSAFVDGSSVASTTFNTSAFASGEVALYDNSSQSFDNVSIAVPEPTGAVLGFGVLTTVFFRRRKLVG